MHQVNHNFRFNPLNFMVDKVKVAKEYPRSARNGRLRVSYFPELLLIRHKKVKKEKINKKRYQVLPVKGDDMVSQVYFQNRLKLRYVEYFQDQLSYLSGVLGKCMAVTALMKIEQRVQLISKQITFLRLEANKIKADVSNNHLLLKEAIVNTSELRLKLVEKEEARISFDITVFLSKLANTKKDIIQIFKKISSFKQLLQEETI